MKITTIQADNKTLLRLAQDLGVPFSAAKIIYDKAWREAQAEIDALKGEASGAGRGLKAAALGVGVGK